MLGPFAAHGGPVASVGGDVDGFPVLLAVERKVRVGICTVPLSLNRVLASLWDRRTQRDPVCAGQETGPLGRRFEAVVEGDHGPVALAVSGNVTNHPVCLVVAVRHRNASVGKM